MITTISCTPHIIYKTRTEYVYPPKGLVSECKAVDVKDGATTKDQLLKLLSEAYVSTLENIAECNIKTKEANKYISEYENKKPNQ